MQALTEEDNVLYTYREHGHALARGIDADVIMAEMYGKIEGCSLGRGGSMHLFDVSKLYGGNAIVSSHLPLAVGMALASKSKRRQYHLLFFWRRSGCRRRISRSDESRSTLGSSCVICL
jgi:TPP-dependent pyruvate/acetoin dehydrogenase alpha subunit